MARLPRGGLSYRAGMMLKITPIQAAPTAHFFGPLEARLTAAPGCIIISKSYLVRNDRRPFCYKGRRSFFFAVECKPLFCPACASGCPRLAQGGFGLGHTVNVSELPVIRLAALVVGASRRAAGAVSVAARMPVRALVAFAFHGQSLLMYCMVMRPGADPGGRRKEEAPAGNGTRILSPAGAGELQGKPALAFIVFR